MSICAGCDGTAGPTACPVHGPFAPNTRRPHKCPVCDGTGKVSRPPWIAGDVQSWLDCNAGPYQCGPCNGTGIIWG